MIKRILYSFLLLTLAVTIKAQDLLVLPTDTVRLDTTSACNIESILIYSVKNTTTDTLKMNWKIVYNTFPHSWTVAYCDPNYCYSSSQIAGHTFQYKLNPGVTGLMQLDVTPTSGTNNGYFQVFTWASNDSVNTATLLNYKASINTGTCTNGISEPTVTQVSLYPNPVRSDLKLSLSQNLSNGQIDIYDLIGSRVYSQAISSREVVKEFDLSGLQNGIYVVRVSDSGRVVATRKFTKED